MDEVLQLRIVLLEQQRLGDFPLGHLLVMQQPDHAALALQDVFEFLVGHGLAGNLGLLGFEPRTQGLWVPGTGPYSSRRRVPFGYPNIEGLQLTAGVQPIPTLKRF